MHVSSVLKGDCPDEAYTIYEHVLSYLEIASVLCEQQSSEDWPIICFKNPL